VCAIVYAAPRTELKELQQLREMLMHKVSPALLSFTPNGQHTVSMPLWGT